MMLLNAVSGFTPLPIMTNDELQEERAASVHRALDGTLTTDASYGLEVRYGATTPEIASAAAELSASIVVVGAAPHHQRQRLIAGVRASQVLQRLSCPVLSVWPGSTMSPKRAVVAIDFTPTSTRAAEEALALFTEPGVLTLVHVLRPPPSVFGGTDHAENRTHAKQQLKHLRETLISIAHAGVCIQTRIEEGAVPDAVLTVASQVEADLIAVGTHGPSALERFFVGSVAATLLHSAHCTVLASPPAGIADSFDQQVEAMGTEASERTNDWAPLLAEFTARNLGRPAHLEVDGPKIGAQVQAWGYVLRGVTYDPNSEAAQIMLGTVSDAATHLTRSMEHVKSVAISRDAAGRDLALHIVDPFCNSRLTFDSGRVQPR
jgi:universal stress protein E